MDIGSEIVNNLNNAFSKKHKCITFYLMADYPNRDDFFRNLDILVSNGMDILELGIPIKNPHLDGKTIVHTHHTVLDNGFDETILVELLMQIKEKYPSLPLIIMTYHEGINKYDLLSKGEYYDVILCPDEYLTSTKVDVNLIQIYNEEMGDLTIRKRISNNQGFAYVVTGLGITGGKGELPDKYLSTMKKIRKVSSIPIQIGFGIHSEEQVKTVLNNGADGVIIGSEIIRKINEDNEEELIKYIQTIVKARG